MADEIPAVDLLSFSELMARVKAADLSSGDDSTIKPGDSPATVARKLASALGKGFEAWKQSHPGGTIEEYTEAVTSNWSQSNPGASPDDFLTALYNGKVNLNPP